MPSTVYELENAPSGTSWVYTLNAEDAILQCRIFGVEPADKLEENRSILSNFITTRRNKLVATRQLPQSPVTLPLESSDSPTLGATEQCMPGQTMHVPQGDLNPTSAFPWHQLVQDTALAVGQQMASALSGMGSQSTPKSASSKVLEGLLTALAITSGADAVPLIHFLVRVRRAERMALVAPDAFMVAVLPRTKGQLRTLWAEAVASRSSLADLQLRVLDFFVPTQLRHSVISQMVYRAQRSNEALPEFIEDLRDCAALLLPFAAEAEILDVVINGLNPETRACLAGFPVPTTLQQLLALSPRIKLVQNLQHQGPPPASHVGSSRVQAFPSGYQRNSFAPRCPDTQQNPTYRHRHPNFQSGPSGDYRRPYQQRYQYSPNSNSSFPSHQRGNYRGGRT